MRDHSAWESAISFAHTETAIPALALQAPLPPARAGMEIPMAKFMFVASYRPEGTKGLIKEGASSRREAIKKLTESLGGTLEAFYFTYGENDIYSIVDVPEAASAIAVSLAVNASGTVKLTTVPLLTAEEVDVACKKTVAYRAPGA